MKRVSILAATAAAFVMGGAGIAVAPASAQQVQQPERIDGKPNLNGIWQAINSANWDIEAHSAGPSPVREMGGAGLVAPGLGIVEGGALPYTPEALARKKENYARRMELDPEVKCYLPGVPRANYMPYPFQVFQSKDYVFFAYEYAGAVRNIYMKDPGPPPADSWMGQSVGKWDGDTLVIEVTGFNDQTWFDRSGNHHSDQLKVTERYTQRGPDHLWYEATIEDPQTFTRPWKIAMPLYRRVEPNAQLMQFKCVEFVEELMYGHLRKKPATEGAPPQPKK
jgi:hypothetical protein